MANLNNTEKQSRKVSGNYFLFQVKLQGKFLDETQKT